MAKCAELIFTYAAFLSAYHYCLLCHMVLLILLDAFKGRFHADVLASTKKHFSLVKFMMALIILMLKLSHFLLKIVKMAILTQVIYRLSIILIKIPIAPPFIFAKMKKKNN